MAFALAEAEGTTPASANGSTLPEGEAEALACGALLAASVWRARSLMISASPTISRIAAIPNSPVCKRCTACARSSRADGGAKCCGAESGSRTLRGGWVAISGRV